MLKIISIDNNVKTIYSYKFNFQAVENIEDGKTPKRKCTKQIKKYTQLNAIKYDLKEPE